jgi:diacylglycerol kinase family enzyme
MRFLAILNRGGGTLRTTDLDAFSARMREKLEEAGHSLDVSIVDGKDLIDSLKAAVAADGADVVLVGGGDGTISAAAACLMDTGKVLAVLPAGTMNLFARSLGMPLDLDSAIAAFATGKVREVDVASANGRAFVHQYSVGMHAKLVKMRDQMDFASRLGKIRASMRAAVGTILNPPSMRVNMQIDGVQVKAHTSGIGITNNLFGEGHLPYADEPDGGQLGVYITTAQRLPHLIAFFANMLVGRWTANAHVEIHTAKKVVLRFTRVHKRHRCVLDGELCEIERETTILIHPKSLRVLVPSE